MKTVVSVSNTYRNELARMVHFKTGAGSHQSKKDKEQSRKGKYANQRNKEIRSFLGYV